MTKSVKYSRLVLALLMLVSAFAFAFSAAAANAQGATGRVRVAHLSPDAPNVDVYVDGAKALSNVPFKAVSDYIALPAGEHRFEVRVAGAAATDKAVIDAKATLEAGKDYTVAAINVVASIAPLVLVDDTAAPAAGKAKVRVVHASPDAPAVDVAVKGGPVLVSNLAFGKASDTLSVDAATYDLEVRVAGTTTVALPLAGTKLEAGKIYTVFAAGKLANIGPVVTAISAAAAPAPATTAAPTTAAAAPATTAAATSASPNLPSTGLGGAASEDGSTGVIIAIVGLVALVAAGSTFALTRRTARK